MTWREYINKEILDSIAFLQTAREALSENDCFGAGLCMGRAQTKIELLGATARHVTREDLDLEVKL